MPNRLLREGILESRAVCNLSETGEIFYRRLMSVVDDYGRFEADVELLRGRLFLRNLDRWPLTRVSEALTECCGMQTKQDQFLIIVYVAEDGNKYLQINNFGQRIRSESKYPDPPSLTYVSSPPPLAARASPPTTPPTTHSSFSEGRAREGNQNGKSAMASTPISALPFAKSRDPSGEDDWEFRDWVDQAYDRHPKKADRVLAELALMKQFAHDASLRKMFDENHVLWCESAAWRDKQGSYAPKLGQWVEDLGWKHPPPKAPSMFPDLE